jgi:hypothetical protein
MIGEGKTNLFQVNEADVARGLLYISAKDDDHPRRACWEELKRERNLEE